MTEIRKYGVLLTTARALEFVVYTQDGLKYAAPTFAAGDVTISKDGGTYASTTNLPVAVGSSWYLVLTAAELTASRVHVLISDLTATQTWLDSDINVSTHGHANAMYTMDLDVVMRGTDGANITAPDNAGITSNGNAIAALNDFDPAADTVAVVTTLTNKTGFSLAATGLDAITQTAIGMIEIAKAIWDRILTGGTHNIVNSAGRDIREILNANVIEEGTAQAATATSITLAVGSSAVDNFYSDLMIIIEGGTGKGQVRTIQSYVGATQVATLATGDDWAIAPDATSDYQILIGSSVHVSDISASVLTAITGDIDANSTQLTTLVNNTQVPKRNVAFDNIPVLMVDSADNVTPKTGLTLTVTRSIDNSISFVAATGTATEIGSGIYRFDASAADMNGAIITLRFSSAGADDSFVTVYTKP